MGVVSAVFGGVLRDVLSKVEPLIFRREVYATACLAGAGVFVGLEELDTPRLLNTGVAIALILTVRTLAVIRKWSLPVIR